MERAVLNCYINNFCIINNKHDLQSRIGMIDDIQGVASVNSNVILYSKDFVDLFKCIKLMNEYSHFPFANTFKDPFIEYISVHNVFLPSLAIITSNEIIKEDHFFFNDEELRQLILNLSAYKETLAMAVYGVYGQKRYFDTEDEYRQYEGMIDSCILFVVNYLEEFRDDFEALLQYLNYHFFEGEGKKNEKQADDNRN